MLVLDLVLVALFAAGLTHIFRALPPFRGWVFRGVKPWACDLCMSWWGAVLATSALRLDEAHGLVGAGVLAVAAVAPSMAVLRWTSQPSVDFTLPE
jgi:hypothetical protein